MIDKETLISIAKLNNLRPWQQEKHYIQFLMLIALSEHPVIFKGGTYLWLFHGLDRFSEDLDFTAMQPIHSDLADKVSETLKLFGVENSKKEITNDDITLSFRISAKGPLNTSEKDLIFVYVEISKREKVIEKPIASELNFDAYNLPVKIISCMNLNEVAAEKVRAILTRDKARDVYDLHFIIKNKNAICNTTLINKKLDYYGLKFSNEVFLQKVEEKRKLWKPELKQIIFKELKEFDTVAKDIRNWTKSISDA